jgi:hypothetical protein
MSLKLLLTGCHPISIELSLYFQPTVTLFLGVLNRLSLYFLGEKRAGMTCHSISGVRVSWKYCHPISIIQEDQLSPQFHTLILALQLSPYFRGPVVTLILSAQVCFPLRCRWAWVGSKAYHPRSVKSLFQFSFTEKLYTVPPSEMAHFPLTWPKK